MEGNGDMLTGHRTPSGLTMCPIIILIIAERVNRIPGFVAITNILLLKWKRYCRILEWIKL